MLVCKASKELWTDLRMSCFLWEWYWWNYKYSTRSPWTSRGINVCLNGVHTLEILYLLHVVPWAEYPGISVMAVRPGPDRFPCGLYGKVRRDPVDISPGVFNRKGMVFDVIEFFVSVWRNIYYGFELRVFLHDVITVCKRFGGEEVQQQQVWLIWIL